MLATKDSLGDRMKMFEAAARTQLPRRLPVIFRIDGKAFHTYTRGCARPFDSALQAVMNDTAIACCKEIQGAQLGYVQSDEISILVHNYKRFATCAWFDNQVQKMVSVAAGTASAYFTAESHRIFGKTKQAVFDARAFILPEAEVCNYFIWRQQDTIRNSIQMLARSVFSHSECDTKSTPQLIGLLQELGISWDDVPWASRYGRAVTYDADPAEAFAPASWSAGDAPLFTARREFINDLLTQEEQ